MTFMEEMNDEDNDNDPELDAKLEFFSNKEEMTVMLETYKENMETKIN